MTNQSCTDMTGMAGTNPATPISGTLYKCTETNVWMEWYTPYTYTYPHPLRSSLSVTSPAGGETWVRGFGHDIIWSSSVVLEPVKIELIKSGSTIVIANTVPVADGSCTWLIPTGQTPGNDYTIKISSGSYADTSDPFTIAAPSAPIVQTLSTQSITASSASLRGTVHPMGLATTFYFEYGLTNAYGSETADVTLLAGDAITAVQASIPGLTASTTYHFHVMATNSAGTTEGTDMTFTTSGDGGGGGGCFITAVQGLNLWLMVLGLSAGWVVWMARRVESRKLRAKGWEKMRISNIE